MTRAQSLELHHGMWPCDGNMNMASTLKKETANPSSGRRRVGFLSALAARPPVT